jgi:hypothetical protein
MSNNIPITARISKGLFGQKVSEPILNVGAAGVSGNNQTSNAPSPNKMMSAPAKQKKNPLEGGDETTSNSGMISGSRYRSTNASTNAGQILTTTSTVPGTSNVDALNKGKKNLGSKYVPSAAETARANKELADAKAKDASTSTTTTKSTPASNVSGEAEGDIYVKDKGDAQSAYQRRSNVRNIKNLTAQEKRNDMRTARAGADKSTPEGKQAFKEKKAEIKQNKRTQRAEVIKSEIESSKNQSQQNIAVGSTKDVLSKQRLTEESDSTKKEQKEGIDYEASQNLDKNKKEDTIKKAGSIATKEFKKPEVSTTPDVVELPGKEEDSAVTKKTNGFFNKKSPMKMKYFK